jgi:hypothetical protein
VWTAVAGSKPTNDTMAEALGRAGANGFPITYDELSRAVLEGLYMQGSLTPLTAEQAAAVADLSPKSPVKTPQKQEQQQQPESPVLSTPLSKTEPIKKVSSASTDMSELSSTNAEKSFSESVDDRQNNPGYTLPALPPGAQSGTRTPLFKKFDSDEAMNASVSELESVSNLGSSVASDPMQSGSNPMFKKKEHKDREKEVEKEEPIEEIEKEVEKTEKEKEKEAKKAKKEKRDKDRKDKEKDTPSKLSTPNAATSTDSAGLSDSRSDSPTAQQKVRACALLVLCLLIFRSLCFATDARVTALATAHSGNLIVLTICSL